MAILLSEFNVKNIIFRDPKKVTHPTGSCHKIEIAYVQNGKEVECCVATNPLSTYGIQECKMPTDMGPPLAYSLPLVCEDTETYTVLNQIFEACRQHLELKAVKKALNKFTMAPNLMDPFYRRRTPDGELVDTPPVLYPKLLTAYRKPTATPFTTPATIITPFSDTSGNDVDSATMFGVRATVVASVLIKEIYIGVKPSIQIKADDVLVIQMSVKPTRKLGHVLTKYAPVTTCVLDAAEEAEVDETEEAFDPEPVASPPQPVTKTRLVRRQQN